MNCNTQNEEALGLGGKHAYRAVTKGRQNVFLFLSIYLSVTSSNCCPSKGCQPHFDMDKISNKPKLQ